jgi:hypothetical protein
MTACTASSSKKTAANLEADIAPIEVEERAIEAKQK